MAKHSVLFIPGSYVVLSVHQPLIDAVSAAGYEINGIYLPSIGPCSSEGYPSPAPSMYDDVAAIADEAEQLADQGTDVVLTGHSYAGVPMSQCTKGLSRVERQQQGKPGGTVPPWLLCLARPSTGTISQLAAKPLFK
ncbi:uncharacterized protein HMPREF1541_06279 [Cyphellophora europaea CBS 101466]|uniref:AB hydrolase-1 domain-containing protein n=1 Tax=Cyphellophora europaea (strain CBS 101466) TaxID=1220924 RepID=W2RRA1_CYPE1|nr:uncharacterized protein HMPREF1541_06279 [Cyphellophora europaea CBS 101466]ETN38248.1 hypothetical protein HMPREF1541_06279 [Cyphellophora europaea CBS 101466]